MQRTEPTQLTQSADTLLRKFKIKVTGNIIWAGGITQLILSGAQFVLGNVVQAWLILSAGVFFSAVAWFYHGQRIPVLVRVAFITLLTAITMMSMVLNGHIGVYWTYPILVACFFLFSGAVSIVATLMLALLFAVTAFYSIPLDESWRLTVTLLIICALGSVFVVLLDELQKLLRKLVVTDTLTGLQNRHLVQQVLERAIYRLQRYQRPASLIMADLDHFKRLNDTHGHLFGDQILKQVAERMHTVLRQDDQLFRVGGEEFLIVLAEASEADAATVAEKLRSLIADQTFKGKTAEVSVTLSLGVAELSPRHTWVEWLNAVDTALLNAKRLGRNQVRRASETKPEKSAQSGIGAIIEANSEAN
ncbi:GGDEF domain-containing protein [Pseudidiomarina insulisalsae]|nr:GGDEF domain-containing protein [Pseudidiomarina insulisalsae]